MVVIVGPTSSGKSELAVALAKKFNGEVISADSRQVYKGLDIGSGKITKRHMQGVAHHLIDVASARRVFTVAQYKKQAEQAIRSITCRGKIPIIAGGTGFYINSLIYGATFPPVPPNAALRKALQKHTPEKLMAMLSALDPARALAIDPQNKQRIIRAIEIVKATGKAVPQISASSPYDILKIGIAAPPEILKQRIEQRLRVRLRRGMVAEVRQLRNSGISWKRLESLGIEYKHVSRFLRGEISRTEMEEKIKSESWRYAKRQMAWFKRDKEIIWIARPEEAFPIVQDFLARSSLPSLDR